MTMYESFIEPVPVSPLIIIQQMLKLTLIISDERPHDSHFTFQFNCVSVIFRELVKLTRAMEHKFTHKTCFSTIWSSLKHESLTKAYSTESMAPSFHCSFPCINLIFIKGMKLTFFSCFLSWVPLSEPRKISPVKGTESNFLSIFSVRKQTSKS